MRRYRRLIYRVVMVYAPNASSQDDLFQEIALALWRSVGRFEGRSQESTWIYRISLNTAISYRRKMDRHQRVKPLDEPLRANPAEPRRERAEWLYAQIRTMSLVDRSLVLLYLDGNSYSEIATVMGITESSVGVKIHRMKARLKGILEDEDER